MPLPQITDPEEISAHRARRGLVDMHFHTRWSDGLATPAQAVASAREQGLKVAITDHNVIEGALKAWSLAGDEAADLVLPGIEITTAERIHLLIYFRRPRDLHHFYEHHVNPFRPRGATATSVVSRPVADLLDELRRYEHLTSAAHPFAAAKNGWMSVRSAHRHIEPLLADLDAVEVLNGEELDGGNAATAELARRRSFGATAGSDGHTLGELGAVAVAVPKGADLFEAVRASALSLMDRRPPGTWRRLLSHSAKAPYFAQRPARFAWRWARKERGEGPLTRSGLLAEDVHLEPGSRDLLP
ncbi:MAG: PHP domain-containing protein [Deltaproteobacteria bacterium]|nr:PHP domain-containing protein [Deltaproteobacteria bacterium]